MHGEPALINGEVTKPLRTEAEARRDVKHINAEYRAAFGPMDCWINVWLDKDGEPHSETVFTVESEMLEDINSPKKGWTYIHTTKITKTYRPLAFDSCTVNLQDEADAHEEERVSDAAEELKAVRDEQRDWRASR